MKKILFVLICCIFISDSAMIKAQDIVSTEKVYTYEELQKDIWTLKTNYRKELTIHTIGKSEFGRKIYAIKIGNGKNNLLFHGAHHGREWITSLLLMKLTENYVKSNNDEDFSLWIVPMVNPDGVTIQQGQLAKMPFLQKRKIKKMNEYASDFSRWKSNGLGIDLNRQYDAGWEFLEKEPSKPFYKGYKGKKPAESKEVQALIALTEKMKPIMAVAYHSSGQEIFWQYKNGVNTTRDYRIAQALANTTGYKLSEPEDDAIGGGYTDWFIKTYHLPAFTMEISPLVEETNPPLSTIKEELKRNSNVINVLIQEAKNHRLVHK